MRGSSRLLPVCVVSLALATASNANAQARASLLIGGGTADQGGAVGHIGVLALQRPTHWLGLRADGIAGSHHGNRVGSLSVALEAAPRLAATSEGDARTRGLFVFVAGGAAATWDGPSRNTGFMLAVGTRVGLGTFIVTAEQRFQQDFSPLLIGLAF
jgi:hypothetical protein